MKELLFPIRTIQKEIGVHQRTLRIYDEEKLLIPLRSPKGRRLYSFEDIEKAKLIQYMTKEMGMNLDGIKTAFALIEYFDSSFNISDARYVLEEICEKKLERNKEQQLENRMKLSKRGRKKGGK